MAKRSLAALAACVLLFGVTSCSGDEEPTTANDEPSESSDAGAVPCIYTQDSAPAKEADLPSDQAAYSGEVPVALTLNGEDVNVTLDADATPCTVNSFTSLAEQGYFDDTPCHRLTTPPGFQVLQCGDPSGTGSGGPGYSFEDELTGQETYGAGTLAMANAGPNTNGSQFFLVYGETQLSPDYTVFGTIDEAGIEVIEGLAADGVDSSTGDGPPSTPITIEGANVN
ncbi:MAG: peptidylprolyl isomerase [Nocardioides sp.]